MIKLQRLGHVLIAVRNLERSRDFYTRILGFKVLEQDPDHGGLFLSIGGHGNTLDLFQAANPDGDGSDSDRTNMGAPGVRHTAFAVETEDDLRDAYFALKDAGVEILRALDHVSQKSIYFHATLWATTPLWRRDDAGACPTGGIAEIALQWRGDRIALGEVRVVKGGECSEPLPRR